MLNKFLFLTNSYSIVFIIQFTVEEYRGTRVNTQKGIKLGYPVTANIPYGAPADYCRLFCENGVRVDSKVRMNSFFI